MEGPAKALQAPLPQLRIYHRLMFLRSIWVNSFCGLYHVSRTHGLLLGKVLRHSLLQQIGQRSVSDKFILQQLLS